MTKIFWIALFLGIIPSLGFSAPLPAAPQTQMQIFDCIFQARPEDPDHVFILMDKKTSGSFYIAESTGKDPITEAPSERITIKQTQSGKDKTFFSGDLNRVSFRFEFPNTSLWKDAKDQIVSFTTTIHEIDQSSTESLNCQAKMRSF